MDCREKRDLYEDSLAKIKVDSGNNKVNQMWSDICIES